MKLSKKLFLKILNFISYFIFIFLILRLIFKGIDFPEKKFNFLYYGCILLLIFIISLRNILAKRFKTDKITILLFVQIIFLAVVILILIKTLF